MILQNRHVTTDEVAHQLQISHGSAYEISHNRLAFHKVFAQWVPQQHPELHKEKHLETANDFWITMVLKVNTSLKESSWQMKMDPPL